VLASSSPPSATACSTSLIWAYPAGDAGEVLRQERHGNRLDADCAPRRGCAIIPVIVIHRQEVRPMYAVSVMGAPLRGRIARLR
jgi:hypothetical protein